MSVYKTVYPILLLNQIENPDADPIIVAQSIASAIESGVNFKKLGNFYLQRIMDAGAIGCEIVLSGKVSGQRSRRERFIAGYLKKCGDPARRDVIKGFAVANPKLGNIGVLVKIMFRSTELSLDKNKLERKLTEPVKMPEAVVEPETEIVNEAETEESE